MTRGKEQKMKEIMSNVFSLSRLQSPASVVADGDPVSVCEIAKFASGSLTYLGVLRRGLNPKLRPVAAEVRFGRSAHLYDSTAGTYVGLTDHVKTRLVPTEGKVFALLPYEVQRVEVRTDASFAAGESVRCDVRVSPSASDDVGTHVIRMTVFGPDGNPYPYYGKKLLASGGAAQLTFPSALNDAKGKWRLEARDAATGVTGAAEFVLR